MNCNFAECRDTAKSLGFCIKHYKKHHYVMNKGLYKLRSKINDWHKNNREKARKNLHKYRRTAKGRFVHAKVYAKNRKHEFLLTFEEYTNEVSKPCYYCNGVFKKTETRIGLDRIDNNLGYLPGNVVSSCVTCNRVKSDCFTKDETKAMINLVLEMRKQNE